MKKYLNITLSSIAFLAAAVLLATHFEYDGIQTILFALLSLVIGYQFGTWTCHFHTKQKGFWITISVFVALNLLHSMIDGASIGGFSSFSQSIAVLSHEFARQPALYIVLWGMITPFITGTYHRLLVVPIIVTGVWLIGVFLGQELFMHIDRAPWLEPLADQAMFLFLGDIIHHIIEEGRKLRNRKDCCHN